MQDPRMACRYGTKEGAIEELADSDYKAFGEGTTPHLEVVTAGVIADLLSRRPRLAGGFAWQRFA